MALTVITDPLSLPITTADYQAQNNRTSGLLLDPDKIFPIDFDNNEIPQGAIVNLGGTMLKAVAAESISGTPSKYVKVDVSAYTAAYVVDLTGVTWDSAYNGYYDVTGNVYLFDEATAYFDGEISETHTSQGQERSLTLSGLDVDGVSSDTQQQLISSVSFSTAAEHTGSDFVITEPGVYYGIFTNTVASATGSTVYLQLKNSNIPGGYTNESQPGTTATRGGTIIASSRSGLKYSFHATFGPGTYRIIVDSIESGSNTVTLYRVGIFGKGSI